LKRLKGGIAKFFCKWISSVKEYLIHFVGVVKEEMDGRILCGEFAKSREPSNLAEEQGSYNKYFYKCKLKIDRALDP
jgi:hypothetical protein